MDDEPITAEFSDRPPQQRTSLEDRVRALEKKSGRTDLWIVGLVWAVIVILVILWATNVDRIFGAGF